MEINYLTDCSKRLPEVCLNLDDLDTANSAYLSWQEPDGTFQNNITHRNSPNQKPGIIGGIGLNKIIVFRNNGMSNADMIGVPSGYEAAIIAVNPALDHYFSVSACSAPDKCVPFKEVLIPKRK